MSLAVSYLAGAAITGIIAWHVTIFACVWDSINGKKPGCAWADNPWVTAISFTVEQRNVDQ